MHCRKSLRFVNTAGLLIVGAYLIGCDAIGDAIAYSGRPLHLAAKRGNVEEVLKLLDEDPGSVNRQDYFGYAPLHMAALYGNANVAELLIDRGANIELKDNHGMRPLHKASRNGQYDVALLLLKHGAEVDAPDIHQNTPLGWAIPGPANMVALLLEHGADPWKKDDLGESPMQKAGMYRDAAIIKLMEERSRERVRTGSE